MVTIKTYNGCFKESDSVDFKSIEDIQIVKKGHFDNLNNTIHYAIRISTPERQVDMMASGDRKRLKQKYVEIRMYLNMDVDFEGIKIEDNTANYNEIEKIRRENIELEKKLEEKAGFRE